MREEEAKSNDPQNLEQDMNSEYTKEQDSKNTEHFDDELPEHSESDLVAKWEEEASIANDKYIRLIAEFENFKKRSLKERIELINTAGMEVISDLLPVMDDLERAIKTMDESGKTDDENLEGVKLIYNKLKSKLESKGLKPMEILGKEFDADHMDAITQIPAENKKQKNKVVDVIEKGYFLNGKVIRHAKVIVGS